MESSNISEPIIKIQIAEMNKSNIPESKVSRQKIPHFLGDASNTTEPEPKMSRQEIPHGQVDSSITSEPIVNVQITAIDMDTNIPEHNL